MSRKRALCIIDMQPYFTTAQCQRTIKAVCKQVGLAKQYSWPIFLVEHIGCGPTCTQIRRAIGRYKLCFRVKKHENDGSNAIVQTAACNTGLSLSLLRICGVNSNACVNDTAKGILSRVPKCNMELVEKACNSGYPSSETRAHLEYIRAGKEKRVKII